MANSDGWNFAAAIPEILAESQPSYGRDFETFSAHYSGFCLRQLYLSKLDLRSDVEIQGRLRAGQLIHQFVEECLSESYPALEIDPRVAYNAGAVRFVGRPTAFDPDERTVWHVKPRDGWYKFHPPIDRHIDQLHVYMGGLGAERGQLVYISMSDLFDIRTWPPNGPMEYDQDRYRSVVRRAESVRNTIISHGIATCEAELPFSQCGCYLCDTETFDLPDSSNVSPKRSDMRKDTDERAATDPTDRQVDLIDLSDREPGIRDSDRYHVPDFLQELDVWVVWDGREKLARAPWQEGTMYPCQWAADSDRDPRQPYQRAKMVAELPVREVHRSWPFPDGGDLPERVLPSVLLPHDPETHSITFIDFDDVRDPDTGQVTGEVLELIDRLGGYAELSVNGTGIHVYTKGTLPDGVRSISAPLTDAGRIEMYDHARFTAGTWRHVESSPVEANADANSTLALIAETYRVESHQI